MPRTLGSDMEALLTSQAAGTPVVWILLLEHTFLASPVRLTTNGVDIEHDGETYVALPFEVVLPDDTVSMRRRVELVICNVDQSLVPNIRRLHGEFKVTLTQVVCTNPAASAPGFDTAEVSFPDLSMMDIRYDDQSLRGQLAWQPEDIQGLWLKFNPQDFAGVH